MIIASLAILLILMHFRSAVVICMTLPLAVLVSFILMRHFDIASNIMSLSGIAISIGILVDQAIVMVENATHHLTAHFGHDHKITRRHPRDRHPGLPHGGPADLLLGDDHPLVVHSRVRLDRAGGQDVPSAGLHQELRHDRRGDPLDHAGAGPDPQLHQGPAAERGGKLAGAEHDRHLQALAHLAHAAAEPGHVVVLGAADPRGRAVPAGRHRAASPGTACFLGVVGGHDGRSPSSLSSGARWQVLSFVTLAALALAAYNFPKIGTDYMPPLDEGSILDMPVTVPRASVTEATDDLKARDALLRRFPEVEMIVGKAGRADTPTDPSPLDMVESVITLRPKEYWPQAEAAIQRRRAADGRGAGGPARARPDRADRGRGRSPCAARSGDDERHAALRRGHARTGAPAIPRVRGGAGAEAAARVHRRVGRPLAEGRPPAGARSAEDDIDRLAAGAGEASSRRSFPPARPGGRQPADPADRREAGGGEEGGTQPRVARRPSSTRSTPPIWRSTNVLGVEQPTLFTEMFDFIEQQRDEHWREQVRQLDLRNLRPRRWRPTTGMPSRNSTRRPTKRAFGRRRPRPTAAEPARELKTLARRTRRRLVRSAVRHGTTCSCGTAPCTRCAEEDPRTDLLEGNGQRGADARLGQHLDPADHQPHRHAGHRRADA